MNNVQGSRAEFSVEVEAGEMGIQPSGYLLELSLDWIVLRASENVHHLLGKSHVTLIDEPFGKFVQQQALHDLRNLFSRLSGSTGIARAYRVRLTDEREFFDIAFQQIEERVLLEVVPSPEEGFGEAFGTVGGLIESLGNASGQALLDAGARRMRALTGYDRVTLLVGKSKATSDRSGVPFRSGANATLSGDFPALVANSAASTVPVFPRSDEDTVTAAALLRAPTSRQQVELIERGFAATMRIPITRHGETAGEFRLAHTSPRPPSFELHAAAELFSQLFAMRLEIDELRAPAKAGAQAE
jgi:light-regulated signal transduction histidine kinase (bacteriophytochrome)